MGFQLFGSRRNAGPGEEKWKRNGGRKTLRKLISEILIADFERRELPQDRQVESFFILFVIRDSAIELIHTHFAIILSVFV